MYEINYASAWILSLQISRGFVFYFCLSASIEQYPIVVIVAAGRDTCSLAHSLSCVGSVFFFVFLYTHLSLLSLFSSPLRGVVVVCSSFVLFSNMNFLRFFLARRCRWGLTLNKFRHSGTHACLLSSVLARLLLFSFFNSLSLACPTVPPRSVSLFLSFCAPRSRLNVCPRLRECLPHHLGTVEISLVPIHRLSIKNNPFLYQFFLISIKSYVFNLLHIQ